MNNRTSEPRPTVARLTPCLSKTDAEAEWLELGPRMKRLGYFVDLRRWGAGWAVFAVPAPAGCEPSIRIGQLV